MGAVVTFTSLPPDEPEPIEGSVVMWQGANGTAVQRHVSDGLWHASTGRVLTWQEMCDHARDRAQPLLLIYVPQPASNLTRAGMQRVRKG
jgi:hypothetical protein